MRVRRSKAMRQVDIFLSLATACRVFASTPKIEPIRHAIAQQHEGNECSRT
jgi:hypothetical protein